MQVILGLRFFLPNGLPLFLYCYSTEVAYMTCGLLSLTWLSLLPWLELLLWLEFSSSYSSWSLSSSLYLWTVSDDEESTIYCCTFLGLPLPPILWTLALVICLLKISVLLQPCNCDWLLLWLPDLLAWLSSIVPVLAISVFKPAYDWFKVELSLILDAVSFRNLSYVCLGLNYH